MGLFCSKILQQKAQFDQGPDFGAKFLSSATHVDAARK
jgi:hypothetical protein